jgi:hypothetical protein
MMSRISRRACLTGTTTDGTAIGGCDAVRLSAL